MLGRYEILYYLCNHCGFMQTEEPFWLDEAYGSAITAFDTGLVDRNIDLSKKVAVLLYCLFNSKGSYLDYAGGYGIFTRLMRDIGFDFYWHDPFSQNLVARGFEYDGSSALQLITSFESFEHFTDPMPELDKMMTLSENILFSTELLPTPIPAPDSWWYYGLEHGQHVSFYSKKTLSYIAERYGLTVHSYGSTLHLLTGRDIHPKMFHAVLKFRKILFRYVTKRMSSKTLTDFYFLHDRIKR